MCNYSINLRNTSLSSDSECPRYMFSLRARPSPRRLRRGYLSKKGESLLHRQPAEFHLVADVEGVVEPVEHVDETGEEGEFNDFLSDEAALRRWKRASGTWFELR